MLLNLIGNGKHKQANVNTYITGFILSIILTMAAFLSIEYHWLDRTSAIALIIVLALVQLVVQLLFFLHLGQEGNPRWNLMIFGFMLGIVSILVFGSLWIMHNLNYNHDHRTPDQTNSFIIKDEGIRK